MNFIKALPFLICSACFAHIAIAQELQAMTYNIRYDNKQDVENNWEDRKAKMIQLFEHYRPGVFGIQEGLKHQVSYIDSCLSDYTYIGVGRDDGKEKGEYCALFFDSTRYEIENSATFWLSTTPEQVSVGWDAALERICTYGLFQDKKTNKRFWVFNAHYDHVGEMARQNSSSLILNKIKQLNQARLPLVLMGDFNASVESTTINVFKKDLNDALEIAPKPLYGPPGTFNGFDKNAIMERRIDYIFVSKLNVISYAHIDDRRDNNKHVSDHLPVLVLVNFEK